MAGRSTRNKIRFQFEQIVNNLDKIMAHLQKADELSGGSHPRLDETLPGLVSSVESMKEVMNGVRDMI